MGQYLDTEHHFVWKNQHNNIYGAEVELKISGKKLSALDRRTMVTRMVAKAHRLIVARDDATWWQTFNTMGYLPATPSHIKL